MEDSRSKSPKAGHKELIDQCSPDGGGSGEEEGV